MRKNILLYFIIFIFIFFIGIMSLLITKENNLNNTKLSSYYLLEKNVSYKNMSEPFKQNPSKNTINIYAGGDIMLSRYVGYKAQKDGRGSFIKDFNPIDDYKNGITFYNLESPFSSFPKDTNEITGSFGANVDGVELLKDLIGNTNSGVTSVANNHALDSGKEAFNLTIKTLKENNISYIGAKNTQYLKIIKNEKNICFDGYAYSGNDNIYKKINEENILNSIKNMKQNNCDLIIISLHWGKEYKFDPTQEQEDLAKKLVDNGADIILGHHSHIPGKVEFYKNKLIIYSLGNFLFDQNWGKDECEKRWDCIYDEDLKKDVLPTFIGTLVNIGVDFDGDNKNISIVNIQNHEIDYGKLEKIDKK